jgi:hypothetical protein
MAIRFGRYRLAWALEVSHVLAQGYLASHPGAEVAHGGMVGERRKLVAMSSMSHADRADESRRGKTGVQMSVVRRRGDLED